MNYNSVIGFGDNEIGYNFSGDTSKLYFGRLATIWVRAPATEVVWKSGLVSLIVLVGLCGNFAVIFLVLKQPSIRRLPVNIFIVNLAIADFLTTLFTPIISLICNIYQNYELGPVMCKLEILIKMMCILASIFSMIAISFNRFHHISTASNPRKSSNLNTLAVIILIWIMAILLALPLAIWRQYHQRQWKDYLEKWCADEPAIYSKRYWLFMMTPLIYIPLITMLVVYLLMIDIIDRFIHKLETGPQHNGPGPGTKPISSVSSVRTTVVQSSSTNLDSGQIFKSEINPAELQYSNENGVRSRVGPSSNNTHQLQLNPQQPETETEATNFKHLNFVTVQQLQRSIGDNVDSAATGNSGQPNRQHPLQPQMVNANKHKRSIMITILIYCTITICFWLPLQVLVYYRAFKSKSGQMPPWYDSTKFAAQLICSVNSAINPFITFRRSFAQIFTQFQADRRIKKYRKQRLKQQRQLHKLRNHHHYNHQVSGNNSIEQFPEPITADNNDVENNQIPVKVPVQLDIEPNKPNPSVDTDRGHNNVNSPEIGTPTTQPAMALNTPTTAHLTKRVLMKYTPELFIVPIK